jgi:hypothetical protein
MLSVEAMVEDEGREGLERLRNLLGSSVSQGYKGKAIT